MPDSVRLDERKPQALVVGLDDVRGLYAARTLAREGVDVVGIANDASSYAARTRACSRVIAADTGSERLIETLSALGPRLHDRAILFPCYDAAVVNLSRHREALAPWYSIALPPPGWVDILTDKIRFAAHARKRGLRFPDTRVMITEADANRAAEELTFPVVVKPRSSKAANWLAHTHLKALKASDPSELLALYRSYAPHAEGLIAQQWIDGGDDRLFTCNCYLDAEGTPLVTFVSRKLRQWPPETGEGCLSVEHRADDIVEETMRVFSGMNYRGLGYVEFKREASSGRLYVIEPNVGRPTGRCALVEKSGVALLYTMYCDLAGLPLPPNREQLYLGTKWVWLRRDILSSARAWRDGELSIWEWWRSLRGRKAHAVWSWTDPAPFLADLGRVVRLGLRRNERRKRAPGVT